MCHCCFQNLAMSLDHFGTYVHILYAGHELVTQTIASRVIFGVWRMAMAFFSAFYFAKLAREPTGKVLRNSVFEQNAYALSQHAGSRKQGRPRTAWTAAVYKHAAAAAGGEQLLA
ncbi:unnamed protein product [Polarella glacialis]|uniref:Uncharacterized protein n=1 Tax=Polarella glacialis TaxID=89957 RepID=A0A813L3G6_POLGL|nr:unnamed protein product [Polarella glacialis]CAE8716990.1 unnamed protein product [Polarella glacialis]